MAHYFHSNDKSLCICMKISSVYAREVDMIKMTLNSARESCSLLPSAAEMCGEIFCSGGRGTPLKLAAHSASHSSAAHS